MEIYLFLEKEKVESGLFYEVQDQTSLNLKGNKVQVARIFDKVYEFNSIIQQIPAMTSFSQNFQSQSLLLVGDQAYKYAFQVLQLFSKHNLVKIEFGGQNLAHLGRVLDLTEYKQAFDTNQQLLLELVDEYNNSFQLLISKLDQTFAYYLQNIDKPQLHHAVLQKLGHRKTLLLCAPFSKKLFGTLSYLQNLSLAPDVEKIAEQVGKLQQNVSEQLLAELTIQQSQLLNAEQKISQERARFQLEKSRMSDEIQRKEALLAEVLRANFDLTQENELLRLELAKRQFVDGNVSQTGLRAKAEQLAANSRAAETQNLSCLSLGQLKSVSSTKNRIPKVEDLM